MLGGGEILEESISGRANRAIEDLIEAFPKSTIVIRDGVEVEVPVSDIEIGDIIVVKPGETPTASPEAPTSTTSP